MKAATHQKITQEALQKYIQGKVKEYDGVFKNALWQECIINGTDWEDVPSVDRLTNWHFYPANDLLKMKMWNIVIPSSASLVEERQQELIEELNHGLSERLFTRFGRLLHHIQDMSTPTHVVPVYHGPGLPDPYEDYLEYDWDYLSHAVDADCPGVPGLVNVDQFTELYRAAARATQKALASHNLSIHVLIDGVATQTDSKLFWLTHENVRESKPKHFKHGFGGFGILGEHFGKDEVRYIQGHGYQVNLKNYRCIAATFVNKAIDDSLTALRLFDTLLTQHSLDQ